MIAKRAAGALDPGRRIVTALHQVRPTVELFLFPTELVVDKNCPPRF
jgi:hypothetical protein